MKRVCLLIFVGAFLCWFVLAQSPDEKERLKEKVITNQTLRALKGKISIIGKEGEAVEEQKSEAESESASPQAEVKDEKYWRNMKKEIEERIAKASKTVEDLKEEISGLYRDFYATDDPSRRDKIQIDIVEKTRQLEEAEAELEKAKKEMEDLKERARKEGALPGWLR
ncbi:MAG: hypothetical protein ACUVUG_06955 [Candidatus Aminicenantia bacterium]